MVSESEHQIVSRIQEAESLLLQAKRWVTRTDPRCRPDVPDSEIFREARVALHEALDKVRRAADNAAYWHGFEEGRDDD